MKRNVIKIGLITVLLSMTICACGSDPNQQEAAKEYVSAEASGKQDTASSAPEETVTPDAAAKATQEPATAAPKAAETPKAAEATATPKTTETPAATVKATATPKATATSKATETPKETEATAIPKTTENPATTASEPTTAPTATPEPVHTHTFVDRTVSEATCTEAKVVESVCSVCGASNGTRTEGSALGHDLYEDWFNSPNCTSGGWVTERCHRCDYANGHAGTPLGHDWEETSTTGCDCVTSGVTRQTCKNCGAPGDSWENGQYGDHTWVPYSYDETVIDESAPEGEKIKVIHHEGVYCGNCGEEQ